MDSVFVRGLTVPTLIGVRPWEQQVPQLVVIDVELSANVAAAAARDDLASAKDYGEIARRVTAHVRESRFHLIETLAESIVDVLFRDFAATQVRVSVTKPAAVPNAAGAGVVIERNLEQRRRRGARFGLGK